MADLTTATGRIAARPFPRIARPNVEALLLLLLLIYVAAFGAWPLIRLLPEALGAGEMDEPLGLLRESWQSRAVQRAFWNTLSTSLAAVGIAALLGTLLAFAVSLVNVRGRIAATFLILSPLLIPSQIMALAWIDLMGPSSPVLAPLGLAPAPGTPNPLYSAGGIALLIGIEHMPLVFLAVRASMTSMPNDLIEAARIAGAGAVRIALRVILPLAAPAIVTGSILAFAAAIGNFGIPALLGIPGRYTMLTTLIYQRLNGFGPAVIGQVATLALILVLTGC